MTSLDTPAAEARETLDAFPPDEFQRVVRIDWSTYYFGADSEWHNARTGDVIARGELVEACQAADEWCELVPAPPTAVIPADTRPYEIQAQALDALPVHTLVSYRDHDGELHTLEKAPVFRASNYKWFETGRQYGHDTHYLTRNEVDYTIVRMGEQ